MNTLDDQRGHDRARLGEAWLIRTLGLSTLSNQVHGLHGGAGRPPIIDDMGAVFVLVGE
jgi:hypothetical protein